MLLFLPASGKSEHVPEAGEDFDEGSDDDGAGDEDDDEPAGALSS